MTSTGSQNWGSSNELWDTRKSAFTKNLAPNSTRHFQSLISTLCHGETHSRPPHSQRMATQGTHLLLFINHQRIPWHKESRSLMEPLQDSNELCRNSDLCTCARQHLRLLSLSRAPGKRDHLWHQPESAADPRVPFTPGIDPDFRFSTQLSVQLPLLESWSQLSDY